MGPRIEIWLRRAGKLRVQPQALAAPALKKQKGKIADAGYFFMALRKQKITKDQLHQLIQERFGLTVFFQLREDKRLGFYTTVVAAPADLYELQSRLESICRELRPKYELVAELEVK